MISCILVLFLLAFTPDVLSQVSLTELGPGVVRPSQSFDLTCTVSGASLTDSSTSYSIEWMRQPPGQGMQWVARIIYNDEKYYSQSYQSRVTISRDTAKGEVYLQMREAKADDTGKYYCANYGLGHYYFDHWGPGTFVAVTPVPQTAPHVFTLANCCGGPSADGQFGILATGYLPPDLSYNWKNGSTSITSGIRTSPSTYSSTSGLFFSSSVITASRSVLQSNIVSCTVEHPSTSTIITKTLQVDALCKPRAPPTVKMMQTSCPERDGSGYVGVACIGSSFSSNEYTVVFREDNTEVSLSPITSSVSQESDGTYTVSIYTRMSQAKWNTGTILSCTITDTKTKKVASASFSRCVDNYNVLGINIILMGPTAEDLYINKKPQVRCTAGNLPDANGATFTWIRENVNSPVKPVKQDPEQHTNGVYSQTSLLPLCVAEWEEGEKITCRVNHPKLTNPIEKTISKDRSIIPIRPSVYVYGPTTEEVSRNEMVTITCICKQFLPKDITIKWTQGGNEVDREAYDTTPPQYMKATNDYVCASVMQVEAEVWKSGSVSTCIVVHEGAAHNVIQQSVDKFSGKPSTINMTIAIMDSTSTLTCM